MSGKVSPDADDIALFRQAVGEVKTIKQDTVLHERKKPKPYPRQREADERATLQELSDSWPDITDTETGDELLFQRPGIQNRVMQKLRRGQFTVETELDLHGMTVATAAASLANFLSKCKSKNIRCVRIIHGKGRGSKDGKPVIKSKVNQWLRRRDEVLAYCSARPVDGGTGAIYVLLKKAN